MPVPISLTLVLLLHRWSDLIELNLGTEEEPRPNVVSALLNEEEREAYKAPLLEYRDVFAWTYEGLDPEVAVHRLSINPSTPPVKQGQRRLQPQLVDPALLDSDLGKRICSSVHDLFPVDELDLVANLDPFSSRVRGAVRGRCRR